MEKKQRDKCFEFLKHFWKAMSIMIWLAILKHSSLIFGIWGVVCVARHQRSLQLIRRVEGFGRDRAIEREFDTEVHCDTHWGVFQHDIEDSGAKESREVELDGLLMLRSHFRGGRAQSRMRH